MPANNSRCEATTKTHGTQCVNQGAEWCAFNKKMLCHLHHPDSTFRKQVAAKRGPHMTTPKQTAAIARKKELYPNRQDLAIEGRAQRERGDLPKDEPTPTLNAPMQYLTPDAGRDPHYRLRRHEPTEES